MPLLLIAAEADGRIRLAHADNNDSATLKTFADGQIAKDAKIVSDGHAGYSAKSLGERPHEAVVQTKAQNARATSFRRAIGRPRC